MEGQYGIDESDSGVSAEWDLNGSDESDPDVNAERGYDSSDQPGLTASWAVDRFSDRTDIRENLTGALNVTSPVQTFPSLSLRVVLTEFGCGLHFASRTPAFVCLLGILSPWVVCIAAGEYLSPPSPSCVSLIFAAVFANTAVGWWKWVFVFVGCVL
jgi:hypothetical protein